MLYRKIEPLHGENANTAEYMGQVYDAKRGMLVGPCVGFAEAPLTEDPAELHARLDAEISRRQQAELAMLAFRWVLMAIADTEPRGGFAPDHTWLCDRCLEMRDKAAEALKAKDAGRELLARMQQAEAHADAAEQRAQQAEAASAALRQLAQRCYDWFSNPQPRKLADGAIAELREPTGALCTALNQPATDAGRERLELERDTAWMMERLPHGKSCASYHETYIDRDHRQPCACTCGRDNIIARLRAAGLLEGEGHAR